MNRLLMLESSEIRKKRIEKELAEARAKVAEIVNGLAALAKKAGVAFIVKTDYPYTGSVSVEEVKRGGMQAMYRADLVVAPLSLKSNKDKTVQMFCVKSRGDTAISRKIITALPSPQQYSPTTPPCAMVEPLFASKEASPAPSGSH